VAAAATARSRRRRATELQPTRKEIYRTVERDNLIKIISALRNMVDVADELGGVLECIGD
jgi:hypothetical protein